MRLKKYLVYLSLGILSVSFGWLLNLFYSSYLLKERSQPKSLEEIIRPRTLDKYNLKTLSETEVVPVIHK